MIKSYNAENSVNSNLYQPPGTLVYKGIHNNEASKTDLKSYNNEAFSKELISDILSIQYSTDVNNWINFTGIRDIEQIKLLGQRFNIDNLLLEDVLNTYNRPKVEIEEDYLFISLKLLHKSDNFEITTEQLSLYLNKEVLISFQEIEEDVFDLIRSRIEKGGNKLTSSSIDYLFIRLIDTIVDHYIKIADESNDEIERLEDQVINEDLDFQIELAMKYQQALRALRKAVLPLLDCFISLKQEESKFIKSENEKYLNDVHEHLVNLKDSLDSQREIIQTIRDTFANNNSNKMNEIMKVLTIVSSIFIPLSFMAGLYGMNFKYIPELESENGYFILLGVMVVTIAGMLVYFKKKNWI